jgi:hypothetical protein
VRLVRLAEAAPIVRSKNAGAFVITLDILFDDPARYRSVKESGVITADLVAALYNRDRRHIEGPYFVDNALAIKVSMLRVAPSGDVDDTDVYGAQQHIPLLDVQVPIPE